MERYSRYFCLVVIKEFRENVSFVSMSVHDIYRRLNVRTLCLLSASVVLHLFMFFKFTSLCSCKFISLVVPKKRKLWRSGRVTMTTSVASRRVYMSCVRHTWRMRSCLKYLFIGTPPALIRHCTYINKYSHSY